MHADRRSTSQPRASHRTLLPRACFAALALAVLGAPAACLDRPVAPQQPSTSRVNTILYRSQKVEKIDLLFMIDNSASMGDKQQILAQAVPDLLSKLTSPACIDVTSGATVDRDPVSGECPENAETEFDPIKDIHIGVITSSIGGHGSDQCVPSSLSGYSPHQEDMSHLITRGKTVPAVPTYQDKGYLQWDPDGQLDPHGTKDRDALVADFTEIVGGAGEDGCGYEASLEAWYRFLVDPAPYVRLIPGPCFDGDTSARCMIREGIDDTVLRQRADFVRNDSLLAVVMLSDENDCSVIDEGDNYVALKDRDGTDEWHRARPTDECGIDPNDPECTSCWYADVARHPECADVNLPNPGLDDPINLRCWDQKRRFGVNRLYPIRRYVDALSRRTLDDGSLNPVYCARYADDPNPDVPGERIVDRTRCESAVRADGNVFLGGIVGVPWQDVARNPADLKDGYLPAEELAWTAADFADAGQPVPPGVDETRSLWNVLLGEVDKDSLEIIPTSRPVDPLMIESTTARSGTNPATGTRLAESPVPPDGPGANPINGFERSLPNRDDLQYACTFTLPEPVVCTSQTCDCTSSPENPLCWNASEARYGTTQFKAKAYPGTRQLSVLKGLGAQAIVASICPANVRDADPASPGVKIPDDTDWGYRPAISAIVERLKSALQGACWDQELQPNAKDQVPCVVIEATKGTVDANGQVTCPPCDGVKKPATAQAKASLASDETYQLSGYNCACEIAQADADSGALQACIEQRHPDPSVQGWCYVDPAQHPGADPALVAGCAADRRRMIRFVGDVLDSGGLTYLQCRGASLQSPDSSGK